MQGGVSGFQNAPVTRAVVLTSGLLSVVFSVQRRARALGISYQVGRISPYLLRPWLGFSTLCTHWNAPTR